MDVNVFIDSAFEALPGGDPDARALSRGGEQWWTYRDLRDARNRYVHILREAGVRTGDRVGLVLLNSFDYIALYFAIARIGAVAVRLNFRLAPDELRFLIDDSGSDTVFFHTSRTAQLAPIRELTAVRRWFCLPDDDTRPPDWATVPDLTAASADDCGLPRPSGDQTVMLMYTSGTTGRPKGSVWTHDNTCWIGMIQLMQWQMGADAVTMTTGPFYHAGGFEIFVLPALMAHGTAVFMPSGGMSSERAVDAIHAAGVTHAFLYPAIITDILGMDDERRAALSGLQLVATGGDPLQPWAVDAFADRLPGVVLNKCFGLTEGGVLSAVLDQEHLREHPDSVGRPARMNLIRVVDADGRPLPPGETGEIVVSSPAMSCRYWNRPDATAETFADGWCRTGDLGRITDDGFLVIVGREKDMIRSGGENIYPIEVENVLCRHDQVTAVAVVGVPDERYLEVGCAVVVTATQPERRARLEDELRELARRHLATYKCPRHYVFVDALPVSVSGKVLKRELRERYAGIGARSAPPSL